MTHRARYRFASAVIAVGVAVACGGDGPTQPPPPPGPTVASIEVTPDVDTIPALGATSQFTAVARDASGNQISGQTFMWSSSEAMIASVDASGLVTGQANGTADITASIGNISGSATAVVAQEVDEVIVTPGSATLTTVGATQQFTAEARDANANPIADVTFLWISENPGVATVDTLGIATAVNRGEVTITAAAAGVPGNAALTVALRTYVQVSAGEGHSCGLTTGGDVFCWGQNVDGQLGDGSNNSSNIPVLVTGGHEFASISTGSFHTCGVTTAGEAYCWGENIDGQLGDNSNSPTNVPVVVFGGRTWDQVDGGEGHTCGVESLTADVYCWGRNLLGQLGDGTTNPTNTPLQVAGVQATAVSAGGIHSCAVDAVAGTAQCWGDDSAGELGDGPIVGGGLPVFVMSPAPLASVDAGTAFTCGVSDTGQGFCWGLNGLGELGNGTGVNSDVPVSVGGGLGFSWIDAGVEYACAVSLTGDDGYCWGDNDAFQLGNGTGVGSGTPVLVSGALDLASVSTGRAHTCAVTIEGDVYCWGLNLSGQLGDGTNFNTATPVRVVE